MKTEWTIPVDALKDAGLTDDDVKRVICELARDYDPVYDAAPDLLAALRRFAAYCEQNIFPELQGIACDAFAAIAKAEGV